MIIGSETCTHHQPFLVVVKEISRNKVVVPEGVAGLNIINQIISISCVHLDF